MKNKIPLGVIIACWSLIMFSLTLTNDVLADSEMPARPYVASGGIYYAKCIPGGTSEEAGKTTVYRIAKWGEELICSFDWYSPQIYLIENFGSELPGQPEINKFCSIVRMGFWPRGSEPNETLAVAFYKNCKEIKSYSTADIVRLGYKDPKNIERSVSHYRVFKQIIGFGFARYGGYKFDVVTMEDRTLSFDAATGEILKEEE